MDLQTQLKKCQGSEALAGVIAPYSCVELFSPPSRQACTKSELSIKLANTIPLCTGNSETPPNSSVRPKPSSGFCTQAASLGSHCELSKISQRSKDPKGAVTGFSVPTTKQAQAWHSGPMRSTGGSQHSLFQAPLSPAQWQPMANHAVAPTRVPTPEHLPTSSTNKSKGWTWLAGKHLHNSVSSVVTASQSS